MTRMQPRSAVIGVAAILFLVIVVIYLYLPSGSHSYIECYGEGGGWCSNFSYSGNSLRLQFGQDLLFETPVYYAKVSAEGVGQWNIASDVQYNFSCIANKGYLYCTDIGGRDSQANTQYGYSASINNGTIGPFISKNNSLLQLTFNYVPYTCVNSDDYVYCLGNKFDNNNESYAYYAPISNGTLGSWTSTTPLPTYDNDNPGAIVCSNYNVYLYCYSRSFNASTEKYIQQFYVASITTNGAIGQWRSLTPPFNNSNSGLDGCFGNEGYLTCLSFYNETAYAKILSDGSVGEWINTTGYPQTGTSPRCEQYNSYIYCQGRGSYYANLSSAGITQWIQTTALPANLSFSSCSIFNGYIYCTPWLMEAPIYNATAYIYLVHGQLCRPGCRSITTLSANGHLVTSVYYNRIDPSQYYSLNVTVPQNINFTDNSLVLILNYSDSPNGKANESTDLAEIYRQFREP